jgi:hypothetical protein
MYDNLSSSEVISLLTFLHSVLTNANEKGQERTSPLHPHEP